MFLKRLSGLLLLTIFFSTNSEAQQHAKTVSADSVKLSFYQDSSLVRLSDEIPDKEYWFELLKSDTVLVSFFVAQANNKPSYIYIASIEKMPGSSYQFMIYSRPVNVEPKYLMTYGYATYHVTMIYLRDGRRIIGDVKFNGIVI